MPPVSSADPASALLTQAGIIRDLLAVIEPAIQPYLVEDDTRPDIGEAILRLVLAADALLDLVSPRTDAMAPIAATVGMTPEEAAAMLGADPVDRVFSGRGTREGLDFYPWMHEKTTLIKEATTRFAEAWLRDPRAVALIPEAPVSPKQYLRDELLMELGTLRHNAAKVFDMLFRDHVAVEGRASATGFAAESRAVDPDGEADEGDDEPRLPWPQIPSLRPFADDEADLIKIGLTPGAWTTDPAAWRAGTFADTLTRMQAALDGSSALVRVLNVQQEHGADVTLEPGRAEALLWRRWRPVWHELSHRGRYPVAVTAQVEARMSEWAADRPDVTRLARHGRLVLAVTLRVSVHGTTLDGVMRRLAAADADLQTRADTVRRAYEAALEEMLLDVPAPEPRQILLIDFGADEGPQADGDGIRGTDG